MDCYYNPVRTIVGRECLDQLSDLIENLNISEKKIVVLAWDKSVFELKGIKQAEEKNCWKIDKKVFQASNPTVKQLYKLYREMYSEPADLIIAVGGGSVMDMGKSLCLIQGIKIESEDELREIIQKKKYPAPSARWIGVPTTAGTGSEVTCWATIWDPEKEAKRSVESQSNYAYAAIVDSSLAETMPVRLAVSSALDAAAHAMESYWAKASNLVSRTLALKAIHLIMTHIDELQDGKEEAHKYMAKGSMMAGLAFSNTKTTACHSISYPLTMEYGIPHGIAVSMLMVPVMKVNEKKTGKMKELLEAFGVADPEALGKRIHSILKQAGIKDSLREWSIPEEHLAELAAHGITKGRADNNPVDLTVEKIEEILKKIY